MTSDRPALNTVAALARAGLLPAERVAGAQAVERRYAVALTPHVAGLIDVRDPHDPIALQFLPDPRELETRPEELADPIGDRARSPVRGLVHRYPDRVLLKLASVCPVYCRFCFRREMVGPALGEALSEDDLARALGYVGDHPAVWEVILTGGDPLILSPRRIADVGRRLAAIPHVKVLRWHTRVPMVAPERVTDELVAALRLPDRAVWMGVHANHVRELTDEARAACARLVAAGIPLVSQTVLLRGVNDSVEALEALMRAFVETGIRPYYLHHADLAPGTSHLRTTLAQGRAIVGELRRRLSGLAMPTYVLDIPGGHGKVPADAKNVTLGRGSARVTDAAGMEHDYPEASPAES